MIKHSHVIHTAFLLTPATKRVLLRINWRCQPAGECFEFKERMARGLKINTRTVYRGLRMLREKGLITAGERKRRIIKLTDLGKAVVYYLLKRFKEIDQILEKVKEGIQKLMGRGDLSKYVKMLTQDIKRWNWLSLKEKQLRLAQVEFLLTKETEPKKTNDWITL